MEASNGIRERMTQAERRLDQAENARSRIWDKINGQATEIALILAELKAISKNLDEAKKARLEAADESGDRRFQAMMVVLAAVAGPLVLGAVALISGAHP